MCIYFKNIIKYSVSGIVCKPLYKLVCKTDIIPSPMECTA